MTAIPETVETAVVNIRIDRCDVYIGRQAWRYGEAYPASPFANPFKLGRGDTARRAAVAAYCRYLAERPDLIRQLPDLRGNRLGCWCKPLLCHGDVLRALLEEFDDPTLRGERTGSSHPAHDVGRWIRYTAYQIEEGIWPNA